MKIKFIYFSISLVLLINGCSEYFIPTPLGTIVIKEGSGNGPDQEFQDLLKNG